MSTGFNFEKESPAEQRGGSSRWADVKPILALALTLDSSEWEEFLDMRCGADTELRHEVAALLLAHDNDSDFLEEPLTLIGSQLEPPAVAPPNFPKSGDRLGVYRLKQEVGHGGMGTVYLAHRDDNEFEQQVAIKLIRLEKHSEFAVRRFRRERQILARLEHPYIARLIDGGTTEAGVPYLVMEYVPGEPLTVYCERRSLPDDERLRLFLRVCSAVHYAHQRTVIHRDLKPANILVGEGGVPKLLDFGVATMLEGDRRGGEVTQAALRMLTPAYASPEQMRGDEATIRSDVYSLGVILYELLCGERPSLKSVQGSGSWTANEARLSPRLRGVIFQSIRLEPSERYESVQALAQDLGQYLDGVPLQASRRELLSAEPRSIALLPLAGDSPFASELLAALAARLRSLPAVRVSLLPEAEHALAPVADAGYTYALSGVLETKDKRTRLTVELLSTAHGRSEWTATFEETANPLLSLPDSLADQAAFALAPQLSGDTQSAEAGNSKAQAYYARGRFHWNRSSGEPDELARSLLLFMQAIAEDPQYARAHSGVADYYLRLALWGGVLPGESFAAAIDAARQALQLDPSLAEAHATLGFCLWAYGKRNAEAEKHFHLAIAHDPDYSNAHHWFGLFHAANGRPELGVANLRRARSIDPNSPVIAAALGFVHINARRFDDALAVLAEAARSLRQTPIIQETLAWAHLHSGDVESAREQAQQAASVSDRSAAALAVLARAEAAAGNVSAADDICRELQARRKEQYVSSYHLASVLLAVGDAEAALRELRAAVRQGDWWTSWLPTDPRWDPLRTNPSFQGLLRDQPERQTRGKADKIRGLAASLALATALIGLACLWWQRRVINEEPLLHPSFSRLSGDGTAEVATVSPDGSIVVYTTSQNGMTRLWRRRLNSPHPAHVLAALPSEVSGLQFTDNGHQIAFECHPVLQPYTRKLMLVPVTGGTPVPLLGTFPGPAGISADGSAVASVRANAARARDELWLTDVRTGRERLLTARVYPERLSWQFAPQWSEDGSLLAIAVEQHDSRGYSVNMQSVDVRTGASHAVHAPRWLWIQHATWIRGKTGLVVVGREQQSSLRQLWYVPYPSGRWRRLGNELDSYAVASASRDGSMLVAVQLQTLANMYIRRVGPGARLDQITPGTGRYFDLNWTPDGKLLYASDATGSADIWELASDGGDAHQITTGTGLNWAPAASPDGRYLVYHSNGEGSWNLWRTDIDGSHGQKLTDDRRDSNWPSFTRSGQGIVFQRTGIDGNWNLWRVPADGGQAIQLTYARAGHPATGLRDDRIAAWYSALGDNAQHWTLAIFGPDGGAPLRTFPLPVAASPDSKIGWTPAQDGLTFVGKNNGIWNLWTQPAAGGAPYRETSFTAGQIYSFAWSRSGELAFSRGTTTSDVVLLRDTAATP